MKLHKLHQIILIRIINHINPPPPLITVNLIIKINQIRLKNWKLCYKQNREKKKFYNFNFNCSESLKNGTEIDIYINLTL